MWAKAPLLPIVGSVIRILIRTAIYVGSAALGLWLASILLDGFEIHAPGFLVATLIFAGTQFLLSPHVTKMSEQYAVALEATAPQIGRAHV